MLSDAVPMIPKVNVNDPAKTRRKSDKIPAVLTAEGLKQFICPVCKAAFHDNSQLTTHIRQHNKSEETAAISNTCKICAKVLSSPSSLDRHMLVHSGERPYKCSICEMSFTTNGNMHRHMRVHGQNSAKLPRPAKESPSGEVKNKSAKRKKSEIDEFDEMFANKRFASDENDDDSKISHDIESLTCPVCGLQPFEDKNVLDEHVNSVHLEEPAVCIFCQTSFPNASKVNIHYMMNHVNTPRDTPRMHLMKDRQINNNTPNKQTTHGFFNLSFMSFSNKKFPLVAKTYCEKHACLSENTDYTFHCQECDSVFPCREALELHKVTHTSEKSSECLKCNINFESHEECEKHMLEHEPEKVVAEYIDHKGVNDNDIQDLVDKDDFMVVMGLSSEKIVEKLRKQAMKVKKSPLRRTLHKRPLHRSPLQRSALSKGQMKGPNKAPTLQSILERPHNRPMQVHRSLVRPNFPCAIKQESPYIHGRDSLICTACGDRFATRAQMDRHLSNSAMCAGYIINVTRNLYMAKKQQNPSHAHQNSYPQPLLNTQPIKTVDQDEPLDLSMKSKSMSPPQQNEASIEGPIDFSKTALSPGLPVAISPKAPSAFHKLPVSQVSSFKRKSQKPMKLPVILPSQPIQTTEPIVIAPIDDDNSLIINESMEAEDSLASVKDLVQMTTNLSPDVDNTSQDGNDAEIERASISSSPYSTTTKKHQCPQCDRCFPWMSSLKRHLLTHSGLKPHKCMRCAAAFTTKSNRDRHMQNMHGITIPPSELSITEKAYTCKVCLEAIFETATALLEHYKESHTDCKVPQHILDQAEEEIIPKPSEAWSSAVSEIGSAGSHEARSVSPYSVCSTTNSHPQSCDNATEDFLCNVCGSKTENRVSALKHMEQHHPKEWSFIKEKNNIASIEEFAQRLAQDNLAHSTISSDNNNSKKHKYSCTFCHRHFSYVQDLNRHTRSHTGEQPFVCNVCNRRFTLKHSMLRHMKVHQAGSVQDTSQNGSNDESVVITNTSSEEEGDVAFTGTLDIDQSSVLQRLLGVESSQLSAMLTSAEAAAKMLGVEAV